MRKKSSKSVSPKQASESVTSAIFAGSMPNNHDFLIPFQVKNIEKLCSGSIGIIGSVFFALSSINGPTVQSFRGRFRDVRTPHACVPEAMRSWKPGNMGKDSFGFWRIVFSCAALPPHRHKYHSTGTLPYNCISWACQSVQAREVLIGC